MALTLNDDSAECYFNLASAYKDKGDLVEAVKRFKQAIKYDEKNAEAYYEVGCILADSNDDEKIRQAIINFQKACEINKDHEKAKAKIHELKKANPHISI